MERVIELFFKAANMQRWNDHIRPVNLVELDKQAHKIIIAYIIAKAEEDRYENLKINWINLINKFLFDFFYRIVLTDIKPPVFHKMMEKKRNELDNYVLSEIKPILSSFNEEFARDFEKHILSDKNTMEDKIIHAAHYLATDWEFKIISNAGPFIYGIEKTKANIENQIEDHYDLIGVQKIILGKKLYGFLDLCGQLRFQKRWAHIPRVPETSVLGHMLVVAAISYLFTIDTIEKPVDKRIYNNFFGGLFHDLPEVLTRDIISPIKRSIEGLEELIKEYENYQMEHNIYPLIDKKWAEELKYLTSEEFENKIINNGEIKYLSLKEIEKYNEDKYSPVDGELINAADKLAAFYEAKISIRYGISSKELEEAATGIKEEYISKDFYKLDLKSVYNNLEKLIME